MRGDAAAEATREAWRRALNRARLVAADVEALIHIGISSAASSTGQPVSSKAPAPAAGDVSQTLDRAAVRWRGLVVVNLFAQEVLLGAAADSPAGAAEVRSSALVEQQAVERLADAACGFCLRRGELPRCVVVCRRSAPIELRSHGALLPWTRLVFTAGMSNGVTHPACRWTRRRMLTRRPHLYPRSVPWQRHLEVWTSPATASGSRRRRTRRPDGYTAWWLHVCTSSRRRASCGASWRAARCRECGNALWRPHRYRGRYCKLAAHACPTGTRADLACTPRCQWWRACACGCSKPAEHARGGRWNAGAAA